VKHRLERAGTLRIGTFAVRRRYGNVTCERAGAIRQWNNGATGFDESAPDGV